jgi:hypothetical protein
MGTHRLFVGLTGMSRLACCGLEVKTARCVCVARFRLVVVDMV